MTSGTWRANLPAPAVSAVREALGALIDGTLTSVIAENPVYGTVLGGPEGLAIRIGMEQAIRDLLDALERGHPPPPETGAIWRRIGEAEFRDGRSLEVLRAAFRSGTLAVWREAARLASEAEVAAPEVIALAEAIFVYADELGSELAEGYMRAQSDEAGERDRRRQRVSALLLEAEHHDPDSIERAAELARWRIPRTLAVLALTREPGSELLRRLDADALAGSDAEGGWLILPDPDGPGRRAALARALDGTTAALGPAVAPLEAARSRRFARMTLALIERGSIAPGAPVRSSDHLTDLLVLRDPELARELAGTRLAALDAMPSADRARLLATLRSWLAHQRHTPSVAAELHVHPQTVRYRVASLRELLGDALETPEGRFELQLALRLEGLLGNRP